MDMNPPMQTGDEGGTGSPGIGRYACFDRPDRIAGHRRDDFRKALEISPGLRTANESLQRLDAAQ